LRRYLDTHMYFYKTPGIVKKIFPDLTWDIPALDKSIYLTFDDGPVNNITDWVLSVLNDYNIKATFFCIGKNVAENPKLYESILEAKHQVGNHTYNHIKGWNALNETYYKDVENCRHLVDSQLFRPPYGKIMFFQSKALMSKGYEIIMWDVLSGDFDTKITPQKCLANVIKHTEPGSIVVFHDSLKAANNMKFAMPLFIEHFLNEGFEFKLL